MTQQAAAVLALAHHRHLDVEFEERRHRRVVRTRERGRRCILEQPEAVGLAGPRAPEHAVAPRGDAHLLGLVRTPAGDRRRVLQIAGVDALARDVLERRRESDLALVEPCEGVAALDLVFELVVSRELAIAAVAREREHLFPLELDPVVQISEEEEVPEAVRQVETRLGWRRPPHLEEPLDLEHVRVPLRRLLLVRGEVRVDEAHRGRADVQRDRRAAFVDADAGDPRRLGVDLDRGDVWS